jgi:hypothetical protein
MANDRPSSSKGRYQTPDSSSNTENEGDEVDTRRLIVEDFQDLAKLGGDLLKRTVSSGFEVIKEVKEGLPKEASQLISKGKEEVLKGISKEVLQNVMSQTVDKVFAKVREHKLEVTISMRLKRTEEEDSTIKNQKLTKRG